ncbi:Nuclear receptor domain-containing protein [Aphelenchoides besseyi]|nr:Nuclear receptor domain-containing protein [Aphelenchoides besseyi]KAI6198819.1 Nuclear receptor domain-containing protein [Aphelenchoides besseyi]
MRHLDLATFSQNYDSKIGHCVICGYACTHKNYGVMCCNACSAFFRRTIKDKRSYVCLKGKRCRIDYDNPKRTCQYCRFNRCVASGMAIDVVLNRYSQDSLLKRIPVVNSADQYRRCLTDSFNATFVNRFYAKIRCGASVPQISLDGSLSNTMQAMFAEFDVILKYLRQTRIDQFLNDEQELRQLAIRLLYPWYYVHSCYSTLRNSGHRKNTIYFADETCVQINYKSECTYIQQSPVSSRIRNPEIIARSLLSLHTNGINSIIKYSLFDMDAEDFAFISHIFALNSAIQMRPDKTDLQRQLDRTFRTVERHYFQTYKDTALRLGNLILSLNEANDFIKQLEEWVVLLTLNGCVLTTIQKLTNS